MDAPDRPASPSTPVASDPITYRGLIRAEPVLAVLMGTVAGHMMIMGLLLPVLPLYAKTFGVSEMVLGLVLTVFGLGRLLIDIPAGLLAERFGRRQLLLGGPLLIAAGSLGCALTDSFGWLVFYRFLQGLGAGAYMTAAGIVCADVSTPQTRGYVMALYQTALLVGAGSGPALGGLLAATFGYTSAFWFSLLIGLASAALTMWRYRETRPTAAHHGDHTLAAYLPILRNPQVLIALVASLGMFLARSSAFMQLLPLLGAERFRLGPGLMGIGFALLAGANLVMLPTAGRLVQRVGTVPLVVAAALGLAAGMALAAVTTSILVFFLAMIILGLAGSLEGPSLASYAVAHAPGGRYGPITGAMRFAGDLGYVLGPVMLGAVVDMSGFGYRGALLVAAVILVAIAVAFLAVARERK